MAVSYFFTSAIEYILTGFNRVMIKINVNQEFMISSKLLQHNDFSHFHIDRTGEREMLFEAGSLLADSI